MAEKKYVGKGKLGKFGNIEIGLRHDQLVPNDRGYVNLVVSQMRAPDKWENTHTVYVNEYAGRRSEQQPERAVDTAFTNNPQRDAPKSEGDLPFDYPF